MTDVSAYALSRHTVRRYLCSLGPAYCPQCGLCAYGRRYLLIQAGQDPGPEFRPGGRRPNPNPPKRRKRAKKRQKAPKSNDMRPV